MPRAGLTPEHVVATTARLLDEAGGEAPTLGQIAAELGVKTPSLYNHVDGIDGLMRLVALDGIHRLADTLRTAVMGRSGAEGLRAMAHGYRAFATSHPGVYPLTQRAHPGDEEFERAAGRAIEPAIAILEGFGLDGDDLIHATRTVRSSLHGFSLLAAGGGFGLDVDVEASFEWMVAALRAGVRQPSDPRLPSMQAGQEATTG